MAAITKYIMGVLFVLALLFGGLSYHFYGEAQVAQQQVDGLTTQLDNAAKSLKQSIESCNVTMAISSSVAASNAKLQSTLTGSLEGLAALPLMTTQEKQQNASKTITAAPSPNTDDARLSPELMQLLNNTYCDATAASGACTAK